MARLGRRICAGLLLQLPDERRVILYRCRAEGQLEKAFITRRIRGLTLRGLIGQWSGCRPPRSFSPRIGGSP